MNLSPPERPPAGALSDKLARLRGHVQELLKRIQQLEHDHRHNTQLHGSSAIDEEACLNEAARIAKEWRNIEAVVRPGLFREVWELLPDLEIEVPGFYGFTRRYEELLQEVPEDPHEYGWTTEFLLDLRALLAQADPPASVTNHIAEPPERAARRRGRPNEISHENKKRALDLKNAGRSPTEVAAALYGTNNPSTRQKSNRHSILRNFEKSLKKG